MTVHRLRKQREQAKNIPRWPGFLLLLLKLLQQQVPYGTTRCHFVSNVLLQKLQPSDKHSIAFLTLTVCAASDNTTCIRNCQQQKRAAYLKTLRTSNLGSEQRHANCSHCMFKLSQTQCLLCMLLCMRLALLLGYVFHELCTLPAEIHLIARNG